MCTPSAAQRDGCPKIINLGSAKTDLFYERKKYGCARTVAARATQPRSRRALRATPRLPTRPAGQPRLACRCCAHLPVCLGQRLLRPPWQSVPSVTCRRRHALHAVCTALCAAFRHTRPCPPLQHLTGSRSEYSKGRCRQPRCKAGPAAQHRWLPSPGSSLQNPASLLHCPALCSKYVKNYTFFSLSCSYPRLHPCSPVCSTLLLFSPLLALSDLLVNQTCSTCCFFSCLPAAHVLL